MACRVGTVALGTVALYVAERRDAGTSGKILLGIWLCVGEDMIILVGRAWAKERSGERMTGILKQKTL